jgi:hypothetical protein
MNFFLLLGVVLLPAMFIPVPRILNQPAIRFAVQKKFRRPAAAFLFLAMLSLQFFLLPASARGQGVSPDPQRQSLGSLSSVGDIFVNESPAPSELTIYSGDAVRTGASGAAILTAVGNNSFQISRQSQVVFTGDSRYFAELKTGTISIKSSGGSAAAVVRAGNFVVVPTNRNEQTSATIEGMADGSFLVTCLGGNVGVIPLGQVSGLFLQAGQSARISAKGELAAAAAPGPATPQSAGKSHTGWILFGLAGAGAATGIALAVVSGGSHPPVSPASP